MIRVSNMEAAMVRWDSKVESLVESVAKVAGNLEVLTVRIDSGIKTILVFFGIFSTIIGGAWSYHQHNQAIYTDKVLESILRNKIQLEANAEKIDKNAEMLKEQHHTQ
jgi:hypothetical protein